jgi:transposase InsO family protein
VTYSPLDARRGNHVRRDCRPPAPQRGRVGSNWRTFLNHYKGQLLACDFFTVETLWLRTLYVLFFIELETRRVYLAGCTSELTSAWVTQQARQLTWLLQDSPQPKRFLIHDRDTKFTRAFDTVFEAEGLKIIRTPYQAPNANAFAECSVHSVREECLAPLLILGENHLRRVLREYATYYNEARPHQGIQQHTPIPMPPCTNLGAIRRWEVLGGLIHDYYREVA